MDIIVSTVAEDMVGQYIGTCRALHAAPSDLAALGKLQAARMVDEERIEYYDDE